jgi:hypothetical protein
LIAVPSTLTPDFVRANAIREVAPLLLAFALLRAVRAHPAVTAGLLGLLLLQRVTEIGGFIPTVDRRAYFPHIVGFEQLPRDGADPYRVVAQGPLFAPNISALYGLEDVRGYQAMTFARLAETFSLWSIPQPVWSNRVDDLTAPMLSMMNVRYALALPETAVPPMWRLVGRYPGYQLLDNTSALSRAFIPRVVHTGAMDVTPGMQACRDFAAEAWIETDDPPTSMTNGEGSITVHERGSRLTIHASMRSSGWMVVSETAWRGWRATMSGQPLKVHFADRAFLGVYVPAGEHDIDLAFRPKAATSGAIVSIVSVVLLGGFAVIRRRTSKHGLSALSSCSG